MALNPVAHTENVVRSFLRYQVTAYEVVGRWLALQFLLDTHASLRPFREGVQDLLHSLVSETCLKLPFLRRVHYIVMQKGESTMAANQLVQARIDGTVKEEAAAVLAAMGLTVSDAVRLLLTKVAQEKALPFEPLIPNPVTIEAMKEARKGGLPRFDSVQALMDDLHEDD